MDSSPSDDALVARLAQLEQRVHHLERSGAAFRLAVDQLGRALRLTRDRSDMTTTALTVAAEYLEASAGVFYAIVAGTTRLRPMAAVGEVAHDFEAGTLAEVEVGAGLAGAACTVAAGGAAPAGAGNEEAVIWADAAAAAPAGEVGPRPAAGEPAAAVGATTGLAVAMRSGGKAFGVLALYRGPDHAPFNDDDGGALSTLVRQAETAIDNTFLYEEAVRLSLTDGLTGLWNRRQFDLRMTAELSRAIRFGEPFSIMLLDADGLKQVNDQHGHQAGDAMLIELSARMASNVREVDLVARIGGDEFALLLPRTGLAGALRLAHKIRTAIAERPFELGPTSVAPTVSVGVATYPEHGATRTELVGAADAALWRAKTGGRNRVEHAKVAAPLARSIPEG